MTPKSFLSHLNRCRTQAEVERLLSAWFTVKGTMSELQHCRDAAIARIDKILEDGACIGARGANGIDKAA